MKRTLFFICALLFLILQLSPLYGETVTVATKEASPFIIVDKVSNKVYGFSAELLEAVLKKIDNSIEIKYAIYPNIPNFFNAIQSGDVDFGISATTITSERESVYDFSLPYYKTGLGILSKSTPTFGITLYTAIEDELFVFLFIMIIYVFVCGNIMWLIEHPHNPAIHKQWHKGITSSIWWVIVTIATVGYGDVVPQRFLSRLLAVFVMFTGIVLFGVMTASLSSSFTFNKLHHNIETLNDLMGKKVAVVSSSVADEELNKKGIINLTTANNLSEAIQLLISGKVHAVVHDAPLLHYNRKQDPRIKDYHISSSFFYNFDYGIVFNQNRPDKFIEKINVALLKVMESGEYDLLRNKWFAVE
ncbi:MAG: transporter substrate-binding domain-containing protein [Candidatus Magnetoovum sp. WYHC-5]|nr:transporter substrate-binding domain-containing protein [Candidatus Magnetoovum sp. WYHC-5]